RGCLSQCHRTPAAAQHGERAGVLTFALSEDRGADAHMGRTETDRRLEIGTHAHAEKSEAAPACKLLQQCKMQRRLLLERGNAHQALNRKAHLVTAAAYEALRVFGRDTGLLRLLAGVHFDK